VSPLNPVHVAPVTSTTPEAVMSVKLPGAGVVPPMVAPSIVPPVIATFQKSTFFSIILQ